MSNKNSAHVSILNLYKHICLHRSQVPLNLIKDAVSSALLRRLTLKESQADYRKSRLSQLNAANERGLLSLHDTRPSRVFGNSGKRTSVNFRDGSVVAPPDFTVYHSETADHKDSSLLSFEDVADIDLSVGREWFYNVVADWGLIDKNNLCCI